MKIMVGVSSMSFFFFEGELKVLHHVKILMY